LFMSVDLIRLLRRNFFVGIDFRIRPNNGSLGFGVAGPRIWWCERACARSHHQIREVTTAIPKEPQ